MRQIKFKELVNFPTTEIYDNFQFDCIAEGGNFTFHFKWLNDRWNLWVTLPDGSVREAGVEPGVISWTGYSDYGLVFNSEVKKIDRTSLLSTELYIITWQ